MIWTSGTSSASQKRGPRVPAKANMPSSRPPMRTGRTRSARSAGSSSLAPSIPGLALPSTTSSASPRRSADSSHEKRSAGSAGAPRCCTSPPSGDHSCVRQAQVPPARSRCRQAREAPSTRPTPERIRKIPRSRSPSASSVVATWRETWFSSKRCARRSSSRRRAARASPGSLVPTGSSMASAARLSAGNDRLRMRLHWRVPPRHGRGAGAWHGRGPFAQRVLRSRARSSRRRSRRSRPE